MQGLLRPTRCESAPQLARQLVNVTRNKEQHMAKFGLNSPQVVKRILDRQFMKTPGFHEKYEPCIMANRSEAPRVSRPTTMYVPKFGRNLQLMSLAEALFAALAAYCPDVWDLHEQHMLHPFEGPHPLEGCPEGDRMRLPSVRGTEFARTRVPGARKSTTVTLPGKAREAAVVRPLIGDLLLFRRIEGRAFVLNWSVKKRASDFGSRPLLCARQAKRTQDERFELSIRNRIEELYFEDIGIRTAWCAEDMINPVVRHNLMKLVGVAASRSALTGDNERKLIVMFRDLVGTRETPLSILDTVSKEFDVQPTECLRTLYRAVWNREIRLDLFSPILPDKPLRPEREDVLDVYSEMYRG